MKRGRSDAPSWFLGEKRMVSGVNNPVSVMLHFVASIPHIFGVNSGLLRHSGNEKAATAMGNYQ
jgi:hypothetical protein